MARKGQRRTRTISVPAEWLASLERFKTGPPRRTLQQLGDDLGKALGLPRPVPISTVHDYLRGHVVTEELTRAFSVISGLPLPPLETQAPLDPELREWLELGAELRAEVPERFRRQLDALRDLVLALKRHRFP